MGEIVKRIRRRAESANGTISNKKKLADRKENMLGVTTVSHELSKHALYQKAESMQLDDPFVDIYNREIGIQSLSAVSPPYNPNVLRRMPLENNVLAQCIDAMVLNIENTGYQIEFIGDDSKKGAEKTPAAKAELQRIKSFLDAPNEEYDLVELRKRIRRDKETFGYAFFEVVRDSAGFISAVYHIPAHSMRITCNDPKSVFIDASVLRAGVKVSIKRHKKFRRFIQRDTTGQTWIYFKEFGDPRDVSSETGKVTENLPEDKKATEVLVFADYKSGWLYGLPRWINQIPSILGSRESEILNLNFFKDNAIPSMAVLVAGGYLSQDSVDALADKFTRNRGQDKMHEVIILEAYGDEQAARPDGQMPVPKVQMQPLVGDRQGDALFQEFDKECQAKIRSSFRLAPVFLGGTDDYTYASVNASMIVCESQVFQPERDDVDNFINRYFLGDGINKPQFWAFRSNPTRIVDDAQIANSLTTLNNIGALTPNDAIKISNQMFNLNVTPIPHVWADYPFSLVLKLIEMNVPIQDMDALVDVSEKLRLETVQADLKTKPADTKPDKPQAKKALKDVVDTMIDKMKP